MIDCTQAREHLGAYYDGECPEDLRQDLVRHLSSCTSCRQSLDEWVALSARVFDRPGVKAPAFLWTRVLAGIAAQETERGQAWWQQWRWMAGVTIVASLLVGLVSVYLLNQPNGSIDLALEGRSGQQQAIILASASVADSDQAVPALIEEDSWVAN